MLATFATLVTLFAPQSPSGVVINELSYDDDGSDTLEFIELYNGGVAPVDITGWTLNEMDGGSTSSGNQHTIGAFVLNPGEFYVVGDTGVPNIDETLGYSLENGADGVFLADAAMVYQDGVVWENDRWTQPVPSWLEGDGLWGDIVLHEHVGNFNSISRSIDGVDTDDNGCDFRVAPWTPGDFNLLGMTTQLPYTNDFDDVVGSTVDADWTYSFVSGNTQDPAAVIVSDTLTTAFPPSPQGGNISVWHDAGGLGNANWLKNLSDSNYLLEAYVYFEGPSALMAADDGHTAVIGVRGHCDSYGEFPDVGGWQALTGTTSQHQSGHTGIAWVYNRSSAVSDVYLVDFNNGGDDFNVLAGPISIVAGVNDGWQRLRIDVRDANIVANFGGNYGCDDGDRYTATTSTICNNGVYLSFREDVANNDHVLPLMVDALVVTNSAAASSSIVGTGSPTSVGTPAISLSGGPPVLGNAAFAISGTGMIPNHFFNGLIVDFTPPLPGIQIPGAPAGALLYVAPTIVVLGVSDAGGNVTHPVPLPCAPASTGAPISYQLFDWDFTLPDPLPLGMSEGLSTVVGY